MTGGSPVPVLLAAAGDGWEAEALDRLERAAPAVVVVKRCLDLTDLLASVGTGQGGVAVVSPRLAGLDGDSVGSLRDAGAGVVAVATPGDLGDGDAERLRRLGIEHLLTAAELGALVDTVTAAAEVHDSEARSSPAPPTSADAQRDGRMVTVWGPAGAPGRTTVAVGLAAEVAAAGHTCLLLDADPYGGAVAQHLGVLDEVSGLLSTARAANAGRLDAERLTVATRRIGERLHVLTGLPRADRWAEVRPAAFDALLEQAARQTPYVVVDVGFSLERDAVDPFVSGGPQRNLMTLAALDRADEVVVVGAADPVSLARLARGLVELRDLLPAVRPRVVVNRTRSSLGWSDREIHGMVEGFVQPLGVHFLPDDRAAADRALMAGRSLAEGGDSPLREAMRDVALGVLGQQPARRKGIRRRRGAGGR